MTTTRLAFVDVPRLLRDVIAHIVTRQPLVEVVTLELEAGNVANEIAARGIDVLVAGPAFDEPHAMARLLETFPRLKALVLINDGREAAVYELRPVRYAGELSSQTLESAVEASRARWETMLVGPSRP